MVSASVDGPVLEGEIVNVSPSELPEPGRIAKDSDFGSVALPLAVKEAESETGGPDAWLAERLAIRDVGR